ncbi:MAG: SH3 domain-containing protein [Deferribacterota bacterium]|nr:SH3 domain-containing protein [Deferribacterota bacterium]
MGTSYILGLIYRLIFTLLIFYTFLFANDYIERLGVVKGGTFILLKPNKDAKKLVRLYDGQTVIIAGEENNYYKVKINNYRYGFVQKKYITFKNVLKDSGTIYEEKKVVSNIKTILTKFNKKLSDAEYFKTLGVIPQFLFHDYKLNGTNFNLELIYKCKKIDNTLHNKIGNDKYKLNKIVDKLIYLLFYNMQLIQNDMYEIRILTNKDGSLKPYVAYRLKPNYERDMSVLQEDLSRFVDMYTNIKEPFKECP